MIANRECGRSATTPPHCLPLRLHLILFLLLLGLAYSSQPDFLLIVRSKDPSTLVARHRHLSAPRRCIYSVCISLSWLHSLSSYMCIIRKDTYTRLHTLLRNNGLRYRYCISLTFSALTTNAQASIASRSYCVKEM